MKNTKKGFTLVELLVVIAILAILATVSIVGYTSFINRANESNDNTLITELNNLVRAYKIEHKEMSVNDAIKLCEDNGFSVSKLSPRSDDTYIVWDDEYDAFGLVKIDAASGEITEWVVETSKNASLSKRIGGVFRGSPRHTTIDKNIHIFSSNFDLKILDKYSYHFPTATSDLDEAIERLKGNSNASITLFENVTKDVVIEGEGTVITIDLNRHTITNSGESANAITVKNGAKLVIQGEGNIVAGQSGVAVIWVEQGGELEIKSANIARENYGNGSWYSVMNEGKLTLGEGVTIDVPKNDLAGSGASMIVNRAGAELIIDGGYYYTDGSANVKIEGGKVTINDGTFINGSGQCIMNYGELTINGGDFSLAGRTPKVVNAIINNNTGGSTVIYNGVFRNEVASQTVSSDFIIYTANTNVNIYGGDFLTIGRLFRSGSSMPNIYGGTFEYQSAGNFKLLAKHNIYDYMKDDATIRRIFSAEEPDYDAAAVSVSPEGIYTYYKDVNYNFGLYDGYSFYFYETRTAQAKLTISYEVNVYYMNSNVAEANIIPSSDGYVLVKESIDTGDSGAAKAYKLSCNGDSDTSEVKIGDKYYTTIIDAMQYVKTGDTVTLLKDSTYNDDQSVYFKNDTFTLDLNGKTLTLTKNLIMSTDGVLTITDSGVGATGKIVSESNGISGAKGKVNIENGTIACTLYGSTSGGLINVDTSKVDLTDVRLGVGIYNFDISNYVRRAYAATDNGDGTWKMTLAEGYASASSMKSGYAEVFDGSKFFALKVTNASDLEPYRGQVYNATLTGIDPTEYLADGYIVSVNTNTNLFTAKVKPTANVTSGTYTVSLWDRVKAKYIVYQNGDYYTVKYYGTGTGFVTNATYAGKIVGGVFTAEQKNAATETTLAEGYTWSEQADGTWKVIPQ